MSDPGPPRVEVSDPQPAPRGFSGKERAAVIHGLRRTKADPSSLRITPGIRAAICRPKRHAVWPLRRFTKRGTEWFCPSCGEVQERA